jgi:hypothetical protein
MSDTREAVAVTMVHPTSGHTLDQRRAAMKYHQPGDLPNQYRGESVSSIYFWCNACGKAFLSVRQFSQEFMPEAAHCDFVLASTGIPVEKVHWIKK